MRSIRRCCVGVILTCNVQTITVRLTRPRDRLQPFHHCTRHVLFSTCSRYKHQPLHLQHDHHHHQARRLKQRQIADASEHNRKTNGNRYSVGTTKGVRTLRQVAYYKNRYPQYTRPFITSQVRSIALVRLRQGYPTYPHQQDCLLRCARCVALVSFASRRFSSPTRQSSAKLMRPPPLTERCTIRTIPL